MRSYSQGYERTKVERSNQSKSVKAALQKSVTSGSSTLPAQGLINGELIDADEMPFAFMPPSPVAVILAPARELAVQIAQDAKRLCEFHKYDVAVFVGCVALSNFSCYPDDHNTNTMTFFADQAVWPLTEIGRKSNTCWRRPGGSEVRPLELLPTC